MDSSSEAGNGDSRDVATLRSRMMELLYACGRTTTFTPHQLATILGASVAAVQEAAAASDFVAYSARRQTIHLRRRARSAQRKTDDDDDDDEDHHNTDGDDDDDEERGAMGYVPYNVARTSVTTARQATNAAAGTAMGVSSRSPDDAAPSSSMHGGDVEGRAERGAGARGGGAPTTHFAPGAAGAEGGVGGGSDRPRGWDDVAMYSSTGGLERRAVGAPLRRRGGARGKPYMRAAKALQEKRQVLPLGQVGRVGYVCVADEFDLAGLEAHYRYLSYFTKFDFDVLHVRFADAEMQVSPTAPPSAPMPTTAAATTAATATATATHAHNNSGAIASGREGNNSNSNSNNSSWNYGATAYSSTHLGTKTAATDKASTSVAKPNAATGALVASSHEASLPHDSTPPPLQQQQQQQQQQQASMSTMTPAAASAGAAVSGTREKSGAPGQSAIDNGVDVGKEVAARTYAPHTASTIVPRGGFDLFIFEYGAVVWWGFDQRYFKIVENDFMLPDSAIAKYMTNRYTTRLVNENYPVWCTYTLVAKDRPEADEDFKRRLRFDHFLIPYGQGDVNTCSVSMLCASHALAQSAKIDYLEIKVQELTESCSPLPRDLKEHGGVTISERRLLQLRGEVLSYRLMLKSGSDLLDEPDLFWENAYLKPVFQATKEGFEISERVEALDNKLDAANEILSILADEFSQRHGARLEWIVIWLVFVEVIIGVLELLVDARPWFFHR